jgi:hypothetical protein
MANLFMKGKTLVIILFCYYAFAATQCHRQKLTYRERFWIDSCSFISDSKAYKIYYLDSSWIKALKKMTYDSAFIARNLKIIDKTLADKLDSFRQFYSYRFSLLDTLRIENSRTHLLVLEEYHDTVSNERYSSLNLLICSKTNVLSSIVLSEEYRKSLFNYFTSSIIVNENKKISRTVSEVCSDMANDNGSLPSSITTITKFSRYDSNLGQFVIWRKPIEKIEYNK